MNFCHRLILSLSISVPPILGNLALAQDKKTFAAKPGCTDFLSEFSGDLPEPVKKALLRLHPPYSPDDFRKHLTELHEFTVGLREPMAVKGNPFFRGNSNQPDLEGFLDSVGGANSLAALTVRDYIQSDFDRFLKAWKPRSGDLALDKASAATVLVHPTPEAQREFLKWLGTNSSLKKKPIIALVDHVYSPLLPEFSKIVTHVQRSEGGSSHYLPKGNLIIGGSYLEDCIVAAITRTGLKNASIG